MCALSLLLFSSFLFFSFPYPTPSDVHDKYSTRQIFRALLRVSNTQFITSSSMHSISEMAWKTKGHDQDCTSQVTGKNDHNNILKSLQFSTFKKILTSLKSMEQHSTTEANHTIPPSSQNRPANFNTAALRSELTTQWRIAVPLMAMNLAWFAKIVITTAFLGRLGELPLAGATLGFTFANVTGFSVLNGLCCAMEPMCGQAFGAKNFKLLHKTLVMATSLLLVASIPAAFLWLNVDKILVFLGQQREIAAVAKKYLLYLIPDLIMTSFLSPIKAYLSAQNITLPIMFSSAAAVALHIPVNIILSRALGLQGISMAVWITDFFVVIFLGFYVLIAEQKQGIENWKWDPEIGDWIRLLKLSGPCCLTTCLEWWCYEILVFLTGHLPNANQSIGALAIVLNFDYLLFSVMLSLATCASVRVSNELGAARPRAAYVSAYVSLSVSLLSGFIGGSVMVGARGFWGKLYSREKEILAIVKRTMVIMAIVEVANFPLSVCGGIVRGTARPWLGMYANVLGFYLLALPFGIFLGFKLHLGLGGLLMGFLSGVVVCLVLVLVFISRINWEDEAQKARMSTGIRLDAAADAEGAAALYLT